MYSLQKIQTIYDHVKCSIFLVIFASDIYKHVLLLSSLISCYTYCFYSPNYTCCCLGNMLCNVRCCGAYIFTQSRPNHVYDSFCHCYFGVFRILYYTKKLEGFFLHIVIFILYGQLTWFSCFYHTINACFLCNFDL